MTIHGQGEVNKDMQVLPQVPSVDIEGAKNRKTGLSTSEKYLYVTSTLLQKTEIKADESYLTTAAKVVAKVAIILTTIATAPLVPVQALVGHVMHYIAIKDVKEFVDPIINTLDQHPLKPETRQEIQRKSGITVSLSVDSKRSDAIKEYDRVLKSIDKDFVGEQVEKQAEKIVDKLANIDPSKHPAAIKAIVEAVVNRTSLHENLDVERRSEVAQDLYLAIQDRYLEAEASKVVKTLVDTAGITDFAANVDALSDQMASITQLSVEEARSVTHEAIREEIKKEAVKVEGQPLEDVVETFQESVVTSKTALKNIDTERNELEERIRVVREEFTNLVEEKENLLELVDDYKRNKTVAEMKEILSNQLKEITVDQEKLRRDLKKAETKVGKKYGKKLSKAQKEALAAENKAQIKAFTESIRALDQRKELILQQMEMTDDEIKAAPTPYDQRLQEIELELVATTQQIKDHYTELANFVVQNTLKVEAFKRVMALIKGNTDAVDYSKSLEDIAKDLAEKIIEQSKDDLEGTEAYQKVSLTDFDAFKKFFLSIDFGSQTARAALKVFLERDEMSIAQKDKLAELVADAVGFEENMVQNGHDYLIAFINGETLSNNVEVLPSVILDVMTSDEAKQACEYVAPPKAEQVAEKPAKKIGRAHV